MAIAKGVFRQFILQEETGYGVLPANTGGELLRRVSGQFALTKPRFTSNEITSSQQRRDARHGPRSAQGSLSGQLSPRTYRSVMEGMLRANFAAGVTTGALTTIAAAAGPPGTFTRTGGSFLTDGFKVGDIVRGTGWLTTGLANNGRNYRIVNLTATVMTVVGTGDEVVATKTAGDSVTIAVVGKRCFVPPSGQLMKSYTMEVWTPDADVPYSRIYKGLRVAGMRFMIPASGFCTVDASFVGQDMEKRASRYFTNPTAMTATNSLTGAGGAVRLNGVDIGTITGGQFSIQTAVEANPVVGANIVPEVAVGMIDLEGGFNMMVRDSVVFDIFDSETEVDLAFYMKADTTVNSPFVMLNMSRVKLFSANENDSDRSIMQQVSFTPLEHVNGAGSGTKYEATSITIQDSEA